MVNGVGFVSERVVLDGVFEVVDVENVGGRKFLFERFGVFLGIMFVKFVVEEDVFLLFFVVDNVLVCVFNVGIFCDGDDFGVVVDFVGDIKDGYCIFVVSVVDIVISVVCVRVMVDEVFSIVDVVVSRGIFGGVDIFGVIEIVSIEDEYVVD